MQVELRLDSAGADFDQKPDEVLGQTVEHVKFAEIAVKAKELHEKADQFLASLVREMGAHFTFDYYEKRSPDLLRTVLLKSLQTSNFPVQSIEGRTLLNAILSVDSPYTDGEGGLRQAGSGDSDIDPEKVYDFIRSKEFQTLWLPISAALSVL